MRVSQVIIVLSLMLAIGLVVAYVYGNIRETDRKIEELKARKQVIVNVDSIRSVIEARVIDSLGAVLKKQRAEIKQVKADFAKLKKHSDELQVLYNSLSVSMPDL